jgi:hypothetical protein
MLWEGIGGDRFRGWTYPGSCSGVVVDIIGLTLAIYFLIPARWERGVIVLLKGVRLSCWRVLSEFSHGFTDNV